jgi:hypothetical protein
VSPAELLRAVESDGLRVVLCPDGCLSVRGNQAALARWTDTLRKHKPAIVAALSDETHIRAWLTSIGETDLDTITEVIDGCRRDPDVRAYFLQRATVPLELQIDLLNQPGA